MIRVTTFSLLFLSAIAIADEQNRFALAAPAGWGGETIRLPPGFAPDMKLNGVEHIRFAPGMMQPGSDSFFSYAFAFELNPQPELTAAIVKEDFLRYYRGLCKAVLNGKVPDVDPSTFTLQLKPEKHATESPGDDDAAPKYTRYAGVLEWVEPFATRKPQTLNLEIQTWSGDDQNYVFACVSPQATNADIWKLLHKIRDDYLKK